MNMGDDEYKALTDQEYSRLLKVPAKLRDHAGLVYNKKSKFDWEIRVVLGRLAYDYSQMDEPENGKFLREALVEIETRFPDISPAHIFRQINHEGAKAVRAWWSVRLLLSARCLIFILISNAFLSGCSKVGSNNGWQDEWDAKWPREPR